MTVAQEKLFAGARLRRLRKELSQTQAQFAESLGVSPSYLNLLERNQRPVTARILLSLAEVFDVDVRAFAAESDRQLIADLKEAIADPVLKGADLDGRDVQELTDSYPRAAEALARLHHAYRESNAAAADLALRASGGEGGVLLSPLEEVRNALDQASNYFPSIEEAADRLRMELDESLDLTSALTLRLKSAHGAAVRTYDDEVMGGALRRFDFHARKLLLSDLLEAPGRVFHMAVTLANLELGEVLDQEVHRITGLSEDARILLRSSLASYGAAAMMMPYQDFYDAAERQRYDVDVLRRRFGVSFEQVCHRLTTLHRPGARGVPFFMIRTDQAGNVTKRFGGGVLAFARSGGGCTRWKLYEVFRTPERLHVQGVELTDGSRLVSVARAVSRPLPDGSAALSAVAVGFDVSALERVVYKVDDNYTPIGLSCRLCDRTDCAVRAFPPLQRPLRVEPHLRGAAPFSFGDH